MPNFAYVALDPRGRESRGTMEMFSLAEASRRLKEMGLYPTRIDLQPPAPPARPSRLRRAGSWWRQVSRPRRARPERRVKGRILVTFTRQLATLVEAGLPVVRGLRLLREQETSPRFQRVLEDALLQIESGSTIAEAFGRHPRVFSRLYVSMITAGEASGALEQVLRRLAELLERARRIQGRVCAALFYPASVVVVAALILGLMMIWVLPRFQDVFRDLGEGQPLPAYTRFVFGVSTALRHYLPAVAAAGFGLVALARLWTRSARGRQVFDRFKLRMPLLGPVFLRMAVARFSRTLGTLLGSGVPILQALQIVKETVGNRFVATAVDDLQKSVAAGETLAGPLKSARVFPAIAVGMVEVGEQTGALPDLLFKIADNYEEEVDNAVNAMTSLLEPIMLILLALVVGSIVIAMFLPIISLMTRDTFGGG
jgi:type IV pilus assembly protein PilC